MWQVLGTYDSYDSSEGPDLHAIQQRPIDGGGVICSANEDGVGPHKSECSIGPGCVQWSVAMTRNSHERRPHLVKRVSIFPSLVIQKLLGAPGITTRNKKLLGAKGIATRSKDATSDPSSRVGTQPLRGHPRVSTLWNGWSLGLSQVKGRVQIVVLESLGTRKRILFLSVLACQLAWKLIDHWLGMAENPTEAGKPACLSN